MSAEPMLLDARGLRCPWPVLRLARAMRETQSVLIMADDPQAPQEIAALAEANHWSVAPASDGLIVSRSAAF